MHEVVMLQLVVNGAQIRMYMYLINTHNWTARARFILPANAESDTNFDVTNFYFSLSLAT